MECVDCWLEITSFKCSITFTRNLHTLAILESFSESQFLTGQPTFRSVALCIKSHVPHHAHHFEDWLNSSQSFQNHIKI